MLIYHYFFGLSSLSAFVGLSSASSHTGLGRRAVDSGQTLFSAESAAIKQWDFSKPWKKRIVAVGDLHGDLAHALKVFRSAGMVDHRGEWIGKTTSLVQTGDIVDRGTDTVALYNLMDKLRAQASRAGGEVISLLGNHEYMNAMGDWRYVTKQDIATFQGEANRRRAMSSGWIGQTWLANYSVAAQVPYTPFDNTLSSASEVGFASSGLVAVHGGIHPSWANISHVNTVGHSLLSKCVNARIPASMMMPRDATAEERDFYSETGPVWYRGYALDSEDPPENICIVADEVLRKLGASRLLIGHTPHFEGIRARCRGKIIIIDTGISSAYGGILSALEVVYTLIPNQSGPKSGAIETPKSFWSRFLPTSTKPVIAAPRSLVEKEVITAIYGERREVLVKKERTVELP